MGGAFRKGTILDVDVDVIDKESGQKVHVPTGLYLALAWLDSLGTHSLYATNKNGYGIDLNNKVCVTRLKIYDDGDIDFLDEA